MIGGKVPFSRDDRIAELFRIIDDPSNKNFGDVETERRVQQQRGQQKLQDTDKILRITGHVTLGGKSKARTKFKCYWNRPAILTKEKMLKKKDVNPNPLQCHQQQEWKVTN